MRPQGNGQRLGPAAGAETRYFTSLALGLWRSLSSKMNCTSQEQKSRPMLKQACVTRAGTRGLHSLAVPSTNVVRRSAVHKSPEPEI